MPITFCIMMLALTSKLLEMTSILKVRHHDTNIHTNLENYNIDIELGGAKIFTGIFLCTIIKDIIEIRIYQCVSLYLTYQLYSPKGHTEYIVFNCVFLHSLM